MACLARWSICHSSNCGWKLLPGTPLPPLSFRRIKWRSRTLCKTCGVKQRASLHTSHTLGLSRASAWHAWLIDREYVQLWSANCCQGLPSRFRFQSVVFAFRFARVQGRHCSQGWCVSTLVQCRRQPREAGFCCLAEDFETSFWEAWTKAWIWLKLKHRFAVMHCSQAMPVNACAVKCQETDNLHTFCCTLCTHSVCQEQ